MTKHIHLDIVIGYISIIRQEMDGERKIQRRSRKDCRSGKVIGITHYSE